MVELNLKNRLIPISRLVEFQVADKKSVDGRQDKATGHDERWQCGRQEAQMVQRDKVGGSARQKAQGITQVIL